MHSRTRNLLQLISDETTDAILGELRKGSRTESELVQRSPTSRSVTRSALQALEHLELIRVGRAPSTGKRGPRRNLFEVSSPELLKFCDEADRFALALHRQQGEDLQRHVDELPGS